MEGHRQNDVFDAIAITPWTGEFTLTGQGEQQRVAGDETTADFLRVLGIQPVLGRFFTAAEDQPGGPRLAILTYKSWKQRFNVLVGLPVALTASGILRAILYGISPRDVTVFAGVPVILLIVALGASLLPARRAAKIDTIIALRSE